MPRIRSFSSISYPLALSASLVLTGCGNFFIYPPSLTTGTGTGTGTGTTGSSTVDYVYTSNPVSGATYLAGYNVSSGLLTAATGSPYSLGATPLAITVTPSNKFLYLATTTTSASTGIATGVLYAYSIGTGGALTILFNGAALETENIAALTVSPNGNYLFALDANGLTISEYSINASTGGLGLAASYNISGAAGAAVTPVSIKVAPSGNFFAVALGTGGAETFSFNQSTGIGSPATLISPANTSIGLFAIGIDAKNYLYAAGTVGLQVFSVDTSGKAAVVSSSPYTTGAGPIAVAFAKSYAYVYTANANDSNITGFSIGSNGALTTLTGSPFTAPATVNGLVSDSTGAYLFAAGYNTGNGNELLSVGTTGVLSLAAAAASGTAFTVPTVVATTH